MEKEWKMSRTGSKRVLMVLFGGLIIEISVVHLLLSVLHWKYDYTTMTCIFAPALLMTAAIILVIWTDENTVQWMAR